MNEPLETLGEGRFLRMVKHRNWEYVDRKVGTGVVVIVAVNDEGKLLLVEQYRPPVDKDVIELPAGIVGDIAGQEGEKLGARCTARVARRDWLCCQRNGISYRRPAFRGSELGSGGVLPCNGAHQTGRGWRRRNGIDHHP